MLNRSAVTNKCSAVAEMRDRLATIDMDRKFGGAVPLWEGSWVPIEHSVVWAEAYLPTKWLSLIHI